VAPVALGDPARFRDLSAALAILVGIVLVVLGVLHVGFVSRFISAAVQAGFMFGLGLTIIVGQVPALLGVSKGGGDFFPQLWHLLTHLGDANGWTAAVGLAGLALLLGLKRVAPSVPAALLVVVAGIVVVALGGLADHGVAVIGRIEGAVPTPALPDVGWDELLALLPGALAIAVIGYAETATVGESLADEHGDSVQPDRELSATGVANVLAGLFQGFIAGGGASQSAANDRAGANSQLVSLLVAGLTVLTAVALLPLFRDLPQAALGAIVISAVVGFLNLPALRRIRRLRRDSFALALFTLLGVLVLGVLGGLLVAVAISVVLLLDLQFSAGLDVESLNVLAALHRQLGEQGVELWLANVHGGVGRMLDRSGLADDIGEAHIYRTIADATPDVRAALSS
jgi:SulP family sulfate permease